MKILLTGGAGFIASHLTDKLLNLGHEIVVIDNFHDFYNINYKVRNVLEAISYPKSELKIKEIIELTTKEEKIEKLLQLVNNYKPNEYYFNYGDIRDKELLNKLFQKDKFDLIINIAALAGVRPSLEKPLEYEEVNIKGYMNLLELAKEYKVDKFVQASSSSVYGNNKKVPFSERDSVDTPISPYAATKKAGELLGHVYSSLYKIGMVQLRFFTVYGPRQRPDLAIYKFTDMILKGETIPFYGTGETFRDYTYVTDIVDGIVKSIEYINNNPGVFEVLNLGESDTISLKELVEGIEDALGIKANINRLPMQPGDVDKTYADISKAKELIGYNPQTKFKVGIKLFTEWFRNKTI